MGVFFFEHGQTNEAVDAFRQAITTDPKDSAALYALGVLVADQGQTNEAVNAFRQAVAADPKDAKAWSNLGMLLRELGQTNAAEDAFRQAVAADPKDAVAWYNLGGLYRIHEHYDEARNALEQALLYRPDWASDHAGLGAVYLKLGRPVDAAREINEAQRLCDNDSLYNRACISALCNDLEAAFSLLKQALSNHEVPTDWVCQDPDWDDLREHPEFKKIIENY